MVNTPSISLVTKCLSARNSPVTYLRSHRIIWIVIRVHFTGSSCVCLPLNPLQTVKTTVTTCTVKYNLFCHTYSKPLDQTSDIPS